MPYSPYRPEPDPDEPWRDRVDDAPHPVDALVFATERGRVLRCACCGALELRFGNALLALSAGELPTVLAALVANDTANNTPRSETPPAGATLTLGATGCGWVFDADELAELHRLTAGAALLLELGSTNS